MFAFSQRLLLVVTVVICFCLQCLPGRATAEGLTDTLGGQPLTKECLTTELFHYFSKDDPTGIPVLEVADPMMFSEEFHLTNRLSIWDQQLYGLSQLQFEAISFNLSSIAVQAEARLPVLSSLGQYLWKATVFWNKDESGATNITLNDVRLSFRFAVVPDSDGQLTMTSDHTTLEMTYSSTVMDFENLSIGYQFALQSLIPMIYPSLVEMVKDWMVSVMNPAIQSDTEGWSFPDSISPLDYMMTKVRHQLRVLEKDPLQVDQVAVYLGFGVTLKVVDMVVVGMSTLHRTQEVYLKLVDNTIDVVIQVGTRGLQVTGDWWVPYLPGVGGHLWAVVSSFSVTFELHQKVNFRSPPTLRTLDCHVGDMEVHSTGMGSLDYLVEASINILPNVFRNEILNRFEPQLWKMIQEQLTLVDLKKEILQQVVRIDGGHPSTQSQGA